ncbi:MAG: zinc-ribbon domain-containing protein [Micavibrio sp.]|nr:zinc-ribbon domain-containing protein [Micavibrio sp.]
MQLTCAECHTTYRLDPRRLGAGGRVVRCMQCNHVWNQPAATAEEIADDDMAQGPPPGDDRMFLVEDTPPVTAPEVRAEWDVEEPEEVVPEDPIAFEPLVKGQYFTEDDGHVPPGHVTHDHAASGHIPNAVKPLMVPPSAKGFEVPVMTHRPMGMDARQFGLFTFLLLAFATLSVLFLARGPVMRHMPSMAYFYQSLGFSLSAPGEGLQLAGLSAEDSIAGDKRKLAARAKLTNISEDPIAYPPLEAHIKSAYGAVLKTWEFPGDGSKMLAAGDSIPVTLDFDDAPKDGKTLDVRVVAP